MKKAFILSLTLFTLTLVLLGCPKASKTKKRMAPLFALYYAFEAGKEPSFIIAEDFNKDKNFDLVVTNSGDNTMSYFKGNKDGSFQEQLVFKTGADPICVVAADFNRDGYPDLAELNYRDQNIMIFMNTRFGSFKNTGKIIKPGHIPINLVSGDFNKDGFPDLAVTMRYFKLVVMFGKGTGEFSEPVTIDAGGQPTAIVVGDYNKDKNVDLAVALAGSGNVGVQVFWGKGDGTFDPSKVFKGGGQPLTLLNLDANKDGYMDLLTSSNSLHALTTVLNKQDKTFERLKDFASGDFPKFVAAGDFSGDGLPDIAVSNSTNDTLSVSLGRGDGTFTYPPVYHTVDEYPQGIAVADFNHDGLPDIAVSCRDKNIINVLIKKKPKVPDPDESSKTL